MSDPWQGDNSVLLLSLLSEDGDEGYPGTVAATARFEVTDEDELVVTMTAETLDRPTVINMCNHSYFNLSGHASGDVLDHLVHIPAEEYTPADTTGLPTGELAAVSTQLRAPSPLLVIYGGNCDRLCVVSNKGRGHGVGPAG